MGVLSWTTPASCREGTVKETRVQIPALPHIQLPPPSVPSGEGVALDLGFDRNEGVRAGCAPCTGESLSSKKGQAWCPGTHSRERRMGDCKRGGDGTGTVFQGVLKNQVGRMGATDGSVAGVIQPIRHPRPLPSTQHPTCGVATGCQPRITTSILLKNPHKNPEGGTVPPPQKGALI